MENVHEGMIVYTSGGYDVLTLSILALIRRQTNACKILLDIQHRGALAVLANMMDRRQRTFSRYLRALTVSPTGAVHLSAALNF